MSSKAAKFLAKGKEVTIVGENENGEVWEKQFEIKRRTIRHNLKFIEFITEIMVEGGKLGDLDLKGEDNPVAIIMEFAEEKLLDAARLIVGDEVEEKDVMDSYFDSWADAIEEYLKLNFTKIFGAVQMAQAVGQKSR